MIGVIAKDSESAVVEEFFELFKTPWELYDCDKVYDIVITSGYYGSELDAQLVLVYGSDKIEVDDECGSFTLHEGGKNYCFQEWFFPIYGRSLTFTNGKKALITEKGGGEAVGIELQAGEIKVIRIGYDLFEEANFLLSKGQPVGYATIPTLEIHISLLREMILNAGLPVIEIPAVPSGFTFLACLTHDVDFLGIRRHKFDHTFFGFLYRALIQTPLDVLRRKSTLEKLLKNYKAVISLPFVYLGLAKDFLIQFERYLELEKGLCSTFFIMPAKNNPGQTESGPAPKTRGGPYGIHDIKPQIDHLVSKGCEIGLHGIDAWFDTEKGKEEYAKIAQCIDDSTIGVRMHWLFFSEKSANTLEDAGFYYDSTAGYNETIGFQSGTTQVFRPLEAKKIFELPLHIMDTALFYPDRMGLTEDKAYGFVQNHMDLTEKQGGVLTVNWHHRSLGPERLWDTFYEKLLKELKRRGAWFGTAKNVVTWFKKRRTIYFKKVFCSSEGYEFSLQSEEIGSLPKFILRFHLPRNDSKKKKLRLNKNYLDIPFSGEIDVCIEKDSFKVVQNKR